MAQISGAKSKALTANPKDSVGNTKVSLSKFPAIGTMMGAMAMMDGAEKYGPYNWRDKAVVAHIYVDAARRHLDEWFEGQENAADSKVHHLGHAIACCAILLDAQATGNLLDDRPLRYDADNKVIDDGWLARLFDKMSEVITTKLTEATHAAHTTHKKCRKPGRRSSAVS